ncbi:MAG: hypothetical protein GYA58_14155 [Anaerolineaceae bacterium]|nr:hypothetical protein [Anaerolineaceae bacterium]NMC86418.1 hypothetical protein [Anaerolineaceae bacterium]
MRYLKRIGLNADPFRTPVAEQEISASEDISEFYNYYYPNETPGQESTTPNWLRTESHHLIYGLPGAGKTTTRLNLELDCRTVLDGTLAVTDLFGQEETEPVTIEDHVLRIVQAAAVDLVIQVIEQVTPEDLPFSPQQLDLLRAQVRLGGVALQRMLHNLTEAISEQSHSIDALHKSRAGLGIFWPRVGRYPVRYIGSSNALKQLLAVIRKPGRADWPIDLSPAAPPGFEALWQSVEAARAWGYQRIFILLDGVDARVREPAQMHRLVAPLIEHLVIFQEKKIYFKMFLPLEIKPLVAEQIERIPGLNSMVRDATIQWNQQTLHQLLIQRFRAAGSQTINSLDVLAGDDLERGLEQPIMELAQGSPRKMLTYVSQLINAHVSHRGDQLKIDRGDWDRMKKFARRLPAEPNQ